MSDDYDDDARGGGLWDPDAYEPPADDRPPLRLIGSTVGTASAVERDTLVSLDEFRASDLMPAPKSGRARLPRIAVAVVASAAVIIAAALALIGGTADHARREAVARQLAVDTEQAAARRTVLSPAVHAPRRTARRDRPKSHHSTKPVQSRSSPSQQVVSQRVPTARASQPKKRAQAYNALDSGSTAVLEQPTATTEFGLER